MHRYTKATLFLLLFYGMPLAGRPLALADPRILGLMGICLILLLSQPELSLRDAHRRRDTDQYSVIAILLAGGLIQIAAVMEWAYLRGMPAPDPRWAIPALILIGGGTGLRLWAIRILGRSFTATVQCRFDQEVVTDGPFRLVRHPSYLGAYLGILGSAVLLQSPLTLGIGSVLMAASYAYRISAEERTLLAQLPGYRSYQARTARLLPLVW